MSSSRGPPAGSTRPYLGPSVQESRRPDGDPSHRGPAPPDPSLSTYYPLTWTGPHPVQCPRPSSLLAFFHSLRLSPKTHPPPCSSHPLSLSCFHACHLPFAFIPSFLRGPVAVPSFLEPFPSPSFRSLSTPTSPPPTSFQGVVVRPLRSSTAARAFKSIPENRFRPSLVDVWPTLGPLEVSRIANAGKRMISTPPRSDITQVPTNQRYRHELFSF